MDKQIDHDKYHDESKTTTNRLSKLPDDGDPWAPNNLLTPEQKKTPVEPLWALKKVFVFSLETHYTYNMHKSIPKM